MSHPAGHDTGTYDIENFIKRLLTDDAKPKKEAKPRKWWMLTPEQKRIWIIGTKKDAPTNMHGNGPELSYRMTRTCTTPADPNISPPPPPPPMSFCCERLYDMVLILGPCGFPEAVPVISVPPEIRFRSKILVISGLDFHPKFAKICVIS
jgi:hypothetical protein